MIESVSLETRWFRSWSIEKRSGLVVAGYTIGYFAYVAFGALVFLAIERDAGGDSIFHRMQTAKSNVIKKFPNVSDEALDEFVQEISSAGINGLQTVNDTEAKWTYSQSVFFCVTLLTTIGYGHIAPVSQAGKAVCMLYTAFGIPFTIVLLSGWMELLLRGAKALQERTYSCFKNVLKPLFIRTLLFLFMSVLIGTVFLLLPALLFYHLEEPWTYLDALYFCFISLTTVGLGDFVPGKYTSIEYRPIYRIGVAFYLLIGVVAMMLLMSLTTNLRECTYERKSNEQRDPISTSYQSYGSMNDEKAILIFEDEKLECNNQITN